MIGPYKVLKSIGKGGMGEVLLAYDTICERRIALKRIRLDLLEYKQVRNRFLREAHITSQLTHPAIIPIYAIHHHLEHSYYTMPFVEGNTLKAILRQSRDREKKGEKSETTGSIPYLIRIFLAICQAIAYAHSKGILHRDLKPENIIIGTYGEVLLLDWGLAKSIAEQEREESGVSVRTPHYSTLAGKVVGTVGYMAPERALGNPATKETDIYALGVILYQILTLKLPFSRKNLKAFKANMKKEILYDPIEIAPHRDIPKVLGQITLKCLAVNPENRYMSVDDLIRDVESYIEGRAEWIQIAELNIHNKNDWEFQEHILIAEHTAITRTAEISEWVKLMISKKPFAENIKIETSILPQEHCQGIGILFNVPENSERHQINDGYCLWISVDHGTTLLRNSVEVLHLPEIQLSIGKKHQITIEKIDTMIKLSVDPREPFTYIGRMPISGTHVGILARDSCFDLEPLKIGIGSQNIMVNCLAIPDAFLAHKDYPKALSEYRRIGQAFAGRAEGREAILRAGITLLQMDDYDAALEEFEKLHGTPGAPLEYLGKALVYEQLKDLDEEVKCFELAYRRYPNHPLLLTLQDQILFRLLESSKSDRKAVYQFLLLALCHFKDPLEIPSLNNLMNYLKLHWEPLEFLSKDPDIILTLGFWTHKNYILEERAKNDPLSSQVLLAALNETELALDQLPPTFTNEMILLLDKALDENRPEDVDLFLKKMDAPNTPPLLARRLWAYLLLNDLEKSTALIESTSKELFFDDKSLLHFLYGCWLFATGKEEAAKAHWDGVFEVPFPRSSQIGSLYLTGKLGADWEKKAFDWEKWQLQRQIALFESLKRPFK